jgi:hypothetical protein
MTELLESLLIIRVERIKMEVSNIWSFLNQLKQDHHMKASISCRRGDKWYWRYLAPWSYNQGGFYVDWAGYHFRGFMNDEEPWVMWNAVAGPFESKEKAMATVGDYKLVGCFETEMIPEEALRKELKTIPHEIADFECRTKTDTIGKFLECKKRVAVSNGVIVDIKYARGYYDETETDTATKRQ